MRYQTVLWDFDGTLVDTEPGIIASVIYACEQLGQKVPEQEILKKFIGPPLLHSFQKYLGFSEAMAHDATSIYRENYVAGNIYLAEPFLGVKSLIGKLREAGVKNGVTTLKPEPLARCLLDRFGMTPFFDVIKGSELESSHHMTKAQAIKYALKQLVVTDFTKVVLVGDTSFDEEGAHQCGIDFVAAGYGAGFANPPKCVFYAKDVDGLGSFLL